MKPLKVSYQHVMPLALPAVVPGRRHITSISAEAIRALKADIEAGVVNEVVLIGQNVSVGWRMFVPRPVEFFESKSTSASHKFAQAQARCRIMQEVK